MTPFTRKLLTDIGSWESMSLEGRLEDLGLPDIFQIIGLSKRSGILTVIHREGTARIVFNQGNVLLVSSDKKSRFGYSLVQKGVISYEGLEEALRMQKTTSAKKPLGTIMIEMGIVSQESIEKLLKEHIIDAVKDLLTWETGSFTLSWGGCWRMKSCSERELVRSTFSWKGQGCKMKRCGIR